MGPAALTAAEWRVARPAAEGLTTRAIAEHLTLSPKTVQSHLAHIYRKLDVHSRAQLGAMLRAESAAVSD
jgi:DNA-binding NarL/FixJ family response regulator